MSTGPVSPALWPPIAFRLALERAERARFPLAARAKSFLRASSSLGGIQ